MTVAQCPTAPLLIVKVGGELLEDQSKSSPDKSKWFAENIRELSGAGYRFVICHGGGPQLSRTLQTAGIEPRFVDGKRVTDVATLEQARLVFQEQIQQQLVTLLKQNGVKAVGLSEDDGDLIRVVPDDVRLGFVGQITSINPNRLRTLLLSGFVPVISPLGRDQSGQIYNINADTVAAKIATTLAADRLLIVSNVEGMFENFADKNSLLTRVGDNKLRQLLSDNRLSDGMIPKALGVLDALEAGVAQVSLIDGRVQDSLKRTLLDSQGNTGTTFYLEGQ